MAYSLTMALNMHIHSTEPLPGGLSVVSGFLKGLRQTRIAAGREPDSGTVNVPQETSNWIAAIGYFTIADQIGKCFEPTNSPGQGKNSIEKALLCFTQIGALEAKALYALRNAFTHDFSLYNIGKTGMTHSFRIDPNAPAAVQLPSTPWDGDYKNHANHQTVINLRMFGDLIEDVVKEVYRLAEQNLLACVLPGGPEELIQRYCVIEKTTLVPHRP